LVVFLNALYTDNLASPESGVVGSPSPLKRQKLDNQEPFVYVSSSIDPDKIIARDPHAIQSQIEFELLEDINNEIDALSEK